MRADLFGWLAATAASASTYYFWRQMRLAEQRRLRAEASLRRIEGNMLRLSQAAEGASDAIGIGDMGGNSIYHNPAHIALFGYTVEELNSAPGDAVLFADKGLAKNIHEGIRIGRSWQGETEVITKAGRRVPCFVRADCIRDEDNKPVGIFGVFTDISEKKSTERILDEQRQRLSITLQAIGDGVIATDSWGRIELINPAAEILINRTASEVVGQRLGEIVPLIDSSGVAIADPFHSLQQNPSGPTIKETVFLNNTRRTECLVACEFAPIADANGEFAGAVVVLRDVTDERRQAEERARVTKLESLGLLAGGIAHDFGNLLTALIGHLSLAQRVPDLPPAVGIRLIEVDKVAWRARDLTQQLLTFAKGGTPKKALLELSAILRESVEIASTDSAVRVEFDIAPDLWKLEADSAQLAQVFNNLALNAVQAMGEGGLLEVTAINYRPTPDILTPWGGGPVVKISFRDSGPGIRPEHLKKIFDPFFTTKKEGTGLGLATTYTIIKKHGGHIEAQSVIGQGTTFHVYFPAALEHRAGD